MRMGVRIPLYPALWKFNVNLFVLKGIAHTNFFLKLAIMKTSGIRVALCSSFFLLDFMKTCVFHQNLGSCNQEFINNGVAADIFCSKTRISKTAFFLDTSRQLRTASPPPKKKIESVGIQTEPVTDGWSGCNSIHLFGIQYIAQKPDIYRCI